MFKELWKAHFALFLVNALYGASHVIAKGVMPAYLSPNVFILLRVSGATLLFWLILFSRKNLRIEKKDIPLFALCGLFGVAINQLFFFHGLNLSSSINSGIIMTVNPILVVILSYFIIKEKITLRKSLGILLGATGAVLLTLAGGTGKGDSLLGDMFLFINAASYAIYLVIAKPLMQRYSPLKVITWVFTFGLFYVLLFPPTLTDLSSAQFETIPQDVWIKIVYVIVGVTFMTYLLTMYGLKYLSPSVSSAYIYLQPVLVIFFAVFFSAVGIAEDYTDTITLEKLAYMLLIFTGVYLTSSSSFMQKIRSRRKG
ncbi:MAG: DMT family transporter [Bacteroidetes bacterium]|nr:MAG: DMT family transporter [Bacteroidota bacterium]TNE98107.1 MAG: DMT family transporter [Bacteroidota bacterium]